MKHRDLYFDALRTQADEVKLVFNGLKETLVAMRAIVSLMGKVPGINLQVKPLCCIVLSQESGAWAKWRKYVSPYIIEVNATHSRYRMILKDGKISCDDVIFPIALRKTSAVVCS